MVLSICFVCSGNICRSPSAEVVMRSLLAAEGLLGAVDVSSAGMGDWHVGERADPRSLEALTGRGYDGGRHRARQFDVTWFDRHDLVVAMDRSHQRQLRAIAPAGEERKIRLLTSWLPDVDSPDVPDPYYGGDDGFSRVLDLIERGCRALLDDLRPQLRR